MLRGLPWTLVEDAPRLASVEDAPWLALGLRMATKKVAGRSILIARGNIGAVHRDGPDASAW